MIYNKKTNKIGGRNRRGVGAIIGGVILAAIILSTVFAFFMSMLQNEQARAGYQIQSEQQSRDKDIEEYAVSRYVDNGILYVNVTNTGPIPIAESHWALYCTTCTNPTVPVISSIAKTLNPGEEDGARAIGTVVSGETYVLQVISERGNIITTEDCKVIGPSSATKQCADSDGALTDSAPIQLDTQAFGSIYQDLASRGTGPVVDQRGWDVVVSSAFGNVTGYPGFHIPAGIDVAYTQNVRSLDESGQDLTLNRDTLLSNIDAGRKVTQPIDVVFSIDSSGSMATNDPTYLRLSAAHTFIDKLTQGVDQAAVVSWDGDDDDECVYEVPLPANCTPNPGAAGTDSDWFQSLSFNLNQVKHGSVTNPVDSGKSVCNIPASPPQQNPQTTCGIDDIDNTGGGGTNLEAGLYKAIEVLDANTRVEPSNQIIIFLTDGKVEGGPPFDYTLSWESGPAADAQARGYKIYVIGLVDFDVGKLSDTAAATDGGLYLTAAATNLDTIFLDIHAKSILTTTIPDIVYVCKESGTSLNAYSEVAPNNKVLPATAPDADSTVGWQEVFFCSRTPGTAGNDYQPQNDFTSFHPLIMVLRGQFSNILEEEGQTIPYQSSAVGAMDITGFNVCSKTGNTGTALVPVECAAPTVADNTAAMRYSRSLGQMQTLPGQSVWIHVNTVTTPITVSWLYPDGTTKILNMTNGALAKDVTLAANKNTPFAVRLPTQDSDGTQISCSTSPLNYDSYTIRVTDQYDSEGRRNVYYMTFRVTGC